MRREVWTPARLFDEHQKTGPKAADFGVAATALQAVSDFIEQSHHNLDHASLALTPSLIREWLNEGAVVILSMELRNDAVSKHGGWHMFTFIACDGDLFQVWDTNGFKGFLTEEEIKSGFFYPNGMFFMPHDREDTLVLTRKK